MIKPKAFSMEQITGRLKINYVLLAGLVAVVGMVLRLRQYLVNRSLWRDEASLALNLVEKSFPELTGPLDDRQGGPVLFLWIQKGMMSIFGPSEYALRFLPLVCGIVAILAFWFFVSKVLSKRAALFALIFFALSGTLIEFSSEMKQYSGDVFVTVSALVIFYFLRKEQYMGYLSAIGWGLLGGLLIWLSHPAIFVFAGVGLAVIYGYYAEGRYDKAKFLVIIGGLWIFSFLLFYTISLTSLTNNQELITSWDKGFLPPLSKPFSVIEWIFSTLMGIFRYSGGLFAGLGTFFYVIGAISLYRRDRVLFWGLVLPIALTFFAASLSKYPFANRLTVFTLPLVLVPGAEGIDQLLGLLSRSQFRLAVPFLIIILLFQPLQEGYEYLQKPILKEEIRPVLEHVRDNWQEEDIIYVYYGAYKPFLFYQEQFGFQESDYILGIEARYEWVNYLPDLNRLREYDRVWLVFSHVHSGDGVNEEQLMINWLNRTEAIQKDWFPRAGASAYLYEFH